MKEIIRSPFFYVGDKYKLMPQLKTLIPQNMDLYIEPFLGGGSSMLNTKAKHYKVNDIDPYVIKLHKFLSQYKNRRNELFNELFSLIEHYKLSCSFRNINVTDELKKQYIKTYYAKFNKESYARIREEFNHNQDNLILLYLLLIYGFNHMIRFNQKGLFNLPVGNVDFNKNVFNALNHYMDFIENNDIEFFNLDYKSFLDTLNINSHSYIFLDPPYLISMSEYNKLWNDEKEIELCAFLDELDKKGIKFGITNLIHHKERFNPVFLEWSQKYLCYNIKSNYISFNDNSIKSNSKEVFVTNYENNI